MFQTIEWRAPLFFDEESNHLGDRNSLLNRWEDFHLNAPCANVTLRDATFQPPLMVPAE